MLLVLEICWPWQLFLIIVGLLNFFLLLLLVSFDKWFSMLPADLLESLDVNFLHHVADLALALDSLSELEKAHH